MNSLSRIPPSLAEPPPDGNPLFYCVSTNSCSEPYFVTFALLPSSGAAAQNTRPGQFSTSEAPIKFWNRDIAVQRATLAGATPEDRAERASEKLAQLPLSASADDIVTRPVKVDNQDGIGFVFSGNFLFFLGTADLDKESGEKLEQASDSAMRNLREALQARIAEQSWPVIRERPTIYANWLGSACHFVHHRVEGSSVDNQVRAQERRIYILNVVPR